MGQQAKIKPRHAVKSVQLVLGNRHFVLQCRNEDTSVGHSHGSCGLVERPVGCHDELSPHHAPGRQKRDEVAVERDVFYDASLVNGSPGFLSGCQNSEVKPRSHRHGDNGSRSMRCEGQLCRE